MARAFTSAGTTSASTVNNVTVGSSVSVAFWFLATAASDFTGDATAVSLTNHSTSPCYILFDFGSAANTLSVLQSTPAGGGSTSGTITNDLNVWHHYAMSSAVGGTLYAYRDGVQIGSTGGVTVGNNFPLWLDVGLDGRFGRWIDGFIADVAVWGVQLSASEILALAKGARPNVIRPLSLSVYSPLDGLASPEPDLSGNANNLGLTHSPGPAFGPPLMQFTPRWPQFFPLPAIAAVSPGGFTWVEW